MPGGKDAAETIETAWSHDAANGNQKFAANGNQEFTANGSQKSSLRALHCVESM